ncbi:MAG: hypothetical protein PHN88_07475 [Ignavibacteria bacterium]|nr:hypothetical protein [Ignavibacteria bacterium]
MSSKIEHKFVELLEQNTRQIKNKYQVVNKKRPFEFKSLVLYHKYREDTLGKYIKEYSGIYIDTIIQTYELLNEPIMRGGHLKNIEKRYSDYIKGLIKYEHDKTKYDYDSKCYSKAFMIGLNDMCNIKEKYAYELFEVLQTRIAGHNSKYKSKIKLAKYWYFFMLLLIIGIIFMIKSCS